MTFYEQTQREIAIEAAIALQERIDFTEADLHGPLTLNQRRAAIALQIEWERVLQVVVAYWD